MSLKSKWNKLKNSVSSAISPLKGSLFGGLVAGPVGMYYGSQYDQMVNANKMQNEMIERQNELNMQMWNMQNQYNSPAAQMQRYKDAGLNPNLIYGSVSNGNATSAPEMTATTSLSSRDALASVIHQAIGDSWQVSKKVATSMILKNIDLDLEQKQANVNLTNSKSQRALKSVDTQVPSPIPRSNPYDPRNSDPIWTREKPFDDKSSYGKILNTADTAGRYVQEKYQDWKYISRAEQRHRDWIFQKQLDKGKSWKEAERIAYGFNNKYYF